MAHLTEEWKPVVGFEDSYHISSFGRLRKVCPTCGPKHYWERGGSGTQQGYIRLVLRVCGERPKTILAHILVAAAFLGPRPAGHVVNHKDGNKGNNRLDNLEYVTHSGNHIHAVCNGLRPAMKLNAEKVKAIRELKGIASSNKVAEQFGITRTHVKHIWKRTAWAHLPE